MSASELAIYDGMTFSQKLAYLTNAFNAETTAANLYPDSIEDGNGDAFRHTLWVALNTIDLGGDLALKLGDAHEETPTNTPLAKQMDLENDNFGMLIGLQPIDRSQVQPTVIQWLNSGILNIIENKVIAHSHP